MTEIPLRGPPSSAIGRRDKSQPRPYRMVWACLPVMLVLSAAILLLLGVSWWRVLIVILLLACPASMAVAIYVSEHP